MLINVNQLDGAGLTLFIQQTSSGAAFSGNALNYLSNSGFIGPLAVWTTGGAQTVYGSKTFMGPIGVPYTGATGETVARLYVDQSISAASGAVNTSINGASGVLWTSLIATGAILSAVKVTGSSIISTVNFSGLGGTLVFTSGSFTFISGAAGSAGSSTTKVTGSAAIATPNFTGAGNVTLTYDGTYVRVSGAGGNNTSVTGSSAIAAPNFTGIGSVVLTYNGTYVIVSGVSGVDSSGYFETNFVHRGLVNESISGLKIFTGALGVGNPTATGHAVNLGYLTGVSGSLYTSITGMTGYNIYNTFNITGTGTINNTFSATGSIYNTFNDITNTTAITQITGNFVDISFFCDPVATGLNLFETHVAHSFYFTGAAFACRTTGFGPVNGGILSGKLYQVDSSNTEQTLYTFAFQSGTIYSGSPLFNILVTGRNRVGLTITNSLSGIEKLSIGVFGGSYV